MARKIKALGLALVVVAAMSMATAPSVHAFEVHVKHQANVTLTAAQTQTFVLATSAGNATCTTVTFESTIEGQGTQITTQHTTLTPTMSGCQIFGLAGSVKMNGCKLTATSSKEGHTTAKTAWVDITGCTAGKQIEVNGGFGACIATLGAQHNVGHVVFENNPGEVEDVNLKATLTGVAYELHGGLCGHPTTVVTNNGVTQGDATLRAYKGTGKQQLTQHSHQFQQSTHTNEQVGVLVT
jgi:hypothetical protein